MTQTTFRNRLIAGTAGGTAILALTACSVFAGGTYDKTREVVIPKAELAYRNINPAISMATAYGDRSTGGHGTFGKFPAIFETPFHTHSGAYHGIVLRGVMTNPFKGEANPSKMEPGSYWHVPANSVHATACVSDTPCEFYFHAESGFDFHPVK